MLYTCCGPTKIKDKVWPFEKRCLPIQWHGKKKYFTTRWKLFFKHSKKSQRKRATRMLRCFKLKGFKMWWKSSSISGERKKHLQFKFRESENKIQTSKKTFEKQWAHVRKKKKAALYISRHRWISKRQTLALVSQKMTFAVSQAIG